MAQMVGLEKASRKYGWAMGDGTGYGEWDGKLSTEACGRGEKFLLANLLAKRFCTRREFTFLFAAAAAVAVPFDRKCLLIVCLALAGWLAIP